VAIAGAEKLDVEIATHSVMTEASEFDLGRFVQAQEPVFEQVLEELKSGQKRSHWMWFIFPQLKNLGHSSTAQFYGIASLDEAQAYLGHRLLGERLVICTEILLTHTDTSLNRILGSPDDLKFCSSMTLFSLASSDPVVFKRALDQFCDGRMDKRSLALLGF
jgi:uncharacterized protein (DUF1810 family)